MVLLIPRADFYESAHPGPADVFLIIEIADTSAADDRRRKIPMYARAGITEAWLVDLVSRVIEVYCKPRASRYRRVTVHRPGDALAPLAFPDLSVDVATIVGHGQGV